jgi:hypothetical protein
MTRPDDNSDDLERFISKTLGGLGQRKAPSTLESRVLAELARRAALPWWRQQFAHWPFAARCAFLLASFGSIAAVTLIWILASTDVSRFSTSALTWMRSLSHVMSSMMSVPASLVAAIPPLALYSALALCVLLYGTLLGLGAVGYHILYLDPNSRVSQR